MSGLSGMSGTVTTIWLAAAVSMLSGSVASVHPGPTVAKPMLALASLEVGAMRIKTLPAVHNFALVS